MFFSFKKFFHRFKKIHKGAVLTGIVIVSSFALITMASVLVTPIEKTYEEIAVYQDRLQRNYFAEAGWNYFLYLAGKGAKVLERKEFEKEVHISSFQKGWFSWKILLDPKMPGIYNIRFYGSKDRKEGVEIIEVRFQWVKEMKILEWKHK